MSQAPLPESVPGRFYVITRDRMSGAFELHLDDEDHSSFDLGDDIQLIMTKLRRMNIDPRIADDSIDYAREFGGAQVIMADGRVIPLKPLQTPAKTVQQMLREKEHGRPIRNLPALA